MGGKKPNMKVGIFFRIGSTYIIDAVPLASGEPYADAIQHGGHYDFHETLVPEKPHEHRFKTHDYDYYPRGRVIFFPGKKCFVLYADPCLTLDDIHQVIDLFAIDGQVVEVAGDDHYRCSSCYNHYLE